MQFIFAPIWGRLSDRFGRRPILLISTAGATVSYVFFAIGSGIENHTVGLWVLFLSRAFAGLCGGNITVAQAYIADITRPEERSKGMGLIGMAFGLGFIFGPAVGGLALMWFGLTGPGWFAAAFCAANFVLAWIILSESLTPSSERASQRPQLRQWGYVLAQPRVGALILIFFLATFAFSCFETTLAWLVSDNFNLEIDKDPAKPAATVMAIFVFCGVISAFIQGGAIGRLVKRYGEVKLITASMVLTAISLALLPFVKGDGPLTWVSLFGANGLPWIWMLLVLALLSVGTSLTRPPLFGMLSNLTPAHEQGATIGVAQSAGSLARILGPLFAAPLYLKVPPLPYLICGAISLLAAFIAVQRLAGTRSSPVTSGAPIG
jgi:MFS family permease